MPRARWSVLASAENVSQIRQGIVDFAYANGVSEPLRSDIHLAVSEAVTNAVMHAYRRHAGPGSVEVHAVVTGGWFEARVVDDGSGMTPRNDSPGVGLGLPLIHRLADQVELRPGSNGIGTEIRMRFYLGNRVTTRRPADRRGWGDSAQPDPVDGLDRHQRDGGCPGGVGGAT